MPVVEGQADACEPSKSAICWRRSRASRRIRGILQIVSLTHARIEGFSYLADVVTVARCQWSVAHRALIVWRLRVGWWRVSAVGALHIACRVRDGQSLRTDLSASRRDRKQQRPCVACLATAPASSTMVCRRRRPQSCSNPHVDRPFSNGRCRSADIRCVLLDPVASNGDALIGARFVLA